MPCLLPQISQRALEEEIKKEKVRFYNITEGSIREIQNQLLIARDLGYIESAVFQKLASNSVEIHKMLSSLVRTINQRGSK